MISVRTIGVKFTIYLFVIAGIITCAAVFCVNSIAQTFDQDIPGMYLDLNIDPAESENLLNKGVENFNSERYWVALQYLEEFAQKNPSFSNMGMVKYAMGFSYLKLGNAVKAEQLLTESAKLIKNRPDVYLALAHARLQQEKYAEGAEGIETYIKLKPGDADARVNLCNVYIKLEQYGRAEECFAAAVSMSPDKPELLAQYGTVLLNNGRNTEAYEVLREARRLNPDIESIDYYVGITAYQNGDYETAREALERLDADGTADSKVLAALGGIAAMKEDYRSAEKYFRKSLDADPEDRQVLNNLIICKMKIGRNDEAVAILKKRLAETHNDPAIMAMLVSLYLQIDKYDEARELLETLVEKDPKNTEYLRILALMYDQGLNTEKIVTAWRNYLALKPDDTEARHSLARALKKGNMKEEALAEYAKVVADDPQNEEAYREYGLLCEDMELTQKAIEIYVGMSLLYPDSSFPPARLGMISEKSGDIEKAEEFFSGALEKDEMKELYVYTHMAAIRFGQDRMVEAEVLYRRGLESILQHMEEVFFEFTKEMDENGGGLNLMKLIEISEREKGMEEELDAALEGVHECYARRNDSSGELDYFLELSNKFKMNKKPALRAAHILEENGDPDNRLIGVCEAILKIDVKDVEAHLMMGRVYEKRGDLKEAGMAYKRAVEADPSIENAWNSLVENYRSRDRLSDLLLYAEQKLESNNQLEVIQKVIDSLKEETAGSSPDVDPGAE